MSTDTATQDPHAATWAPFDAVAVRCPQSESRVTVWICDNPIGWPLPDGWTWDDHSKLYRWQRGTLKLECYRNHEESDYDDDEEGYWRIRGEDGDWRSGGHGYCDDEQFLTVLTTQPEFFRKLRYPDAALPLPGECVE